MFLLKVDCIVIIELMKMNFSVGLVQKEAYKLKDLLFYVEVYEWLGGMEMNN